MEERHPLGQLRPLPLCASTRPCPPASLLMPLTPAPCLPCLQRLDLRLTGVASAGALQLEVMRGGYISGSKVGGPLCCLPARMQHCGSAQYKGAGQLRC